MNVITIIGAFPLPFTDNILDAVAGHDMYSFLDGYSGYNQVSMHPDDQEKTTFVTGWGVYVEVVMMFRLKMAPTTFQRTIMENFGEYVPVFMQVFLHNFTVYGTTSESFTDFSRALKGCMLKPKSGQMCIWRHQWSPPRPHRKQEGDSGGPENKFCDHSSKNNDDCQSTQPFPGTNTLA